jgi:hypothetical protein
MQQQKLGILLALWTMHDVYKQPINGWAPGLLGYPFGMRIHIHAARPEKPGKRERKAIGQIHGQGRGRANGGDKWNPRYNGLLHDLITDAAGDQQDTIRKRQSSSQHCPADDLVQCVVPADIFTKNY